MNSFDAKYLKIASAYLDTKIKELHVGKRGIKIEDKKESRLQRFITSIFR